MHQKSFGKLPPVSLLTLGGGGLGMVWGETTFDECVATVHAAVNAGINWIDLAPRYGDGKAELVVGEAFAGRLPEGVRVTSKCNLGNPSSADIEPLVRQSIEGSLERLRLSRLDLFFLHSNVVPDADHVARRPDAASRMSSRPEGSHLRALPDPYVNLSIHTAPDVRPFPWQSCQWAKRVGFTRRSRSNQSRAPLVLRRNRLNLRRAQRMT